MRPLSMERQRQRERFWSVSWRPRVPLDSCLRARLEQITLARSLDAGDRAPACLVCLVVALENACTNSGKSGVLILDEFNHSGYAEMLRNC
jgi:hypothetical protein